VMKVIEMLTEGPVGVGTKWRETRLMMKSFNRDPEELAVDSSPKSLDRSTASSGGERVTGSHSHSPRQSARRRCLLITRIPMDGLHRADTSGSRLNIGY